MQSIYSRHLAQLKNLDDEFELRMNFMFLISNKDSKKDKIQKDLLNIPISEILELKEMKLNHYPLHTAFIDLENVISNCKELDKKLTLKQVLRYLQNSVSNINSRFLYNEKVKSEKGIIIYHEEDTANHIGFVLKLTYGELKEFVKYCLNKLSELENKLDELKEFKNEFNKIYSYSSPRTNAVKSISHSCAISNYYLNDKFEEILVIYEWSYSSENHSDHYYHIKKSDLIKEYSLTNKSEKRLRGIGQISRYQNNINITSE